MNGLTALNFSPFFFGNITWNAMPPAVEARILKHWAAREVPTLVL